VGSLNLERGGERQWSLGSREDEENSRKGAARPKALKVGVSTNLFLFFATYNI
jgi:hypothetical protein